MLNKGTTGTIFIMFLVWSHPRLGIESGTSRTWCQQEAVYFFFIFFIELVWWKQSSKYDDALWRVPETNQYWAYKFLTIFDTCSCFGLIMSRTICPSVCLYVTFCVWAFTYLCIDALPYNLVQMLSNWYRLGYELSVVNLTTDVV